MEFREIINLSEYLHIRAKWKDAFVCDEESVQDAMQTPEFFEFIREFSTEKSVHRLFCGFIDLDVKVLVPFRQIRYQVSLSVGSRTYNLPWAKYTASFLLGSYPVGLSKGYKFCFSDLLIRSLLLIPKCQMLMLPAITKSAWKEIESLREKFASAGYFLHLLNGWRDYHVICLPKTFDIYEKQFSKKKRYNINRQIRLLKDHYDQDLLLWKITEPSQVSDIVKFVSQIETSKKSELLDSLEKYVFLATNKLFLAYVLMCKGAPKGVVVGLRTGMTYKVSNLITHDPDAQFSPGSTLMHLMIKDLIESERMGLIDMGYGTPRQKTTSTNRMEQRACLLISRNRLSIRFSLYLHEKFSAAINFIKSLSGRKVDSCA